MNSRSIIFFISILLCGMVTTPSLAQDTPEKQDKFTSESTWNFLIEPYLMLPYLNGDTGVGNLPDVSIDASSGDIFDHLQMAAMLYGEAYTTDWAISTDIIYMNLKQDVDVKGDITYGSLHAKQFAWETSGFRRMLPWLDLGAGGRLNSLTARADLTLDLPNGTSFRSKRSNKTWLDPIIIARFHNPEGSKYLYQLRGDIGGFGLGSDFTWQMQAYVGYRISQLFQVSGGYRIIGIDYNNGNGEDRFMYDVDTSGIVLRVGFNF
ncbi:MAG TPA: hypothetical protein VKX40_02480 [Aequorivita sp.]|nr:hypothetical protein [Aequorivita sp.]